MDDSDLRVPTIAREAELLFSDGRTLVGSLYLPAATADHAGPTTMQEQLNDDAEFLAFLPDETHVPVILNKAELLALSFEAERAPAEDEPVLVERRVVLECGGQRIEGVLGIDEMEGQSRILDYLNRAERFFPVMGDSRTTLVNRQRISRVIEVRDE